MENELGADEDISALWGPPPDAIVPPAPPPPASPAAPAATTALPPAEDDDRLAALQRDLREAVASIAHRLDRLERQVEYLRTRGPVRLGRVRRA